MASGYSGVVCRFIFLVAFALTFVLFFLPQFVLYCCTRPRSYSVPPIQFKICLTSIAYLVPDRFYLHRMLFAEKIVETPALSLQN